MNEMNLLNMLSADMTHFIWLVMRNTFFSLLNILKDIICDHVRMFVTLSIGKYILAFGLEIV